MSTTAVEGVVAAGRVPGWITPVAVAPVEPTVKRGGVSSTSALTDPTVVKFDCYNDFGDVTYTVTPQTRTSQRACEVNVRTIKTGEQVEIVIAAVFDQQAGDAAEVNRVRDILVEDAEIYFIQAFGWDSSKTPDATTVGNMDRGKVISVEENQPTASEEDIKFTATISVSERWKDVTFSEPAA